MTKTMNKDTFTNSMGMMFIFIPPGRFMMGSPSYEPDRHDDERLHQVTLTKGFWLQTTQVTQQQWVSVEGTNPSHFTDTNDPLPVENVSWYNIQSFIKRLNQMEGTDQYRLPTEAEWEFACRAGTDTPFFFGQCLSTEQANYDGTYLSTGSPGGVYHETTLPVASFPPNAWGLYDMHGNVWEWCQDLFGEYPKDPLKDPHGPAKGVDRIARGGSWASFSYYCRSAFRFGFSPHYRNCSVGFRLSKDL